MKQRIRLTWLNIDQVIIETCELVSANDPIYTEDGQEIDFVFEYLAKQGVVIFEDDVGLFTLQPKNIINIEML